MIHFNVTAHPTSEWTAQQIAEAFPWDSAPRYLLHDRDSIYGLVFRQRVRGMAIREVLTAPRSPWQNPYVERPDRIHPTGMSGPPNRVQRIVSATHAQIVFRLLPRGAHALVARERCPGDQTGSTAGAGVGRGTAGGRRTAPPLRTAGGLKGLSRAEEGCFPTEVDRGPRRLRPLGRGASPSSRRHGICSPHLLSNSLDSLTPL